MKDMAEKFYNALLHVKSFKEYILFVADKYEVNNLNLDERFEQLLKMLKMYF